MKFLDFTFKIGKLKNLKRTGWIRKNIPHPESVADHSFRTAVLAMVLAPKAGVDTTKAIQMALIHDIGELKIGDRVTVSEDGKTIDKDLLQQKDADERNAIKEIFSRIDSDEYEKIFQEFQENITPEAKFVNQLDKLERTIQAYEYENLYNKDLQNFFDSIDVKIEEKHLKKMLDELAKLRS